MLDLEGKQIKLIDFGVARPYLDNDGNHIKMSDSTFTGNIIFSSKNGMANKSLSRRDDLISLTYVLLYLLQGNLSFLISDVSDLDSFKRMLECKSKASPESLCEKSGELLGFVREIHNLEFEETPDYEGLRCKLM